MRGPRDLSFHIKEARKHHTCRDIGSVERAGTKVCSQFARMTAHYFMEHAALRLNTMDMDNETNGINHEIEGAFTNATAQMSAGSFVPGCFRHSQRSPCALGHNLHRWAKGPLSHRSQLRRVTHLGSLESTFHKPIHM